MRQVLVAICFLVSTLCAPGSDPSNERHFEQVPAFEDVPIPWHRETTFGDSPLARADVVLITRRQNGKTEATMILQNVNVVRMDERTNTLTVRLPKKDAPVLRKACRDGDVFLMKR